MQPACNHVPETSRFCGGPGYPLRERAADGNSETGEPAVAPRGGWKVRLLPFSAKTDTAKYSEIGIARYRVCIVVEKLGRYDCRTLVGGDARSATFRPVAAGFVARGRRTGARRGVYVSRKLGFRAAAHTVGCIRRNRLSSRSRSLHRPARAGSKSGREVHRRELRQEGTGWLLHNRHSHIFGSPSHSIC